MGNHEWCFYGWRLVFVMVFVPVFFVVFFVAMMRLL